MKYSLLTQVCEGEIEEMINIVDRNGDGKIREGSKEEEEMSKFSNLLLVG